MRLDYIRNPVVTMHVEISDIVDAKSDVEFARVDLME